MSRPRQTDEEKFARHLEEYLDTASEQALARFIDIASYTLRRMRREREKAAQPQAQPQAKLPGVE